MVAAKSCVFLLFFLPILTLIAPRSFLSFFLSLFQLYEINDDPKRKEFLDDLFLFMQKRGKWMIKDNFIIFTNFTSADSPKLYGEAGQSGKRRDTKFFRYQPDIERVSILGEWITFHGHFPFAITLYVGKEDKARYCQCSAYDTFFSSDVD